MDKRKYASALMNAGHRAQIWLMVCAGLLLSNILLAAFVVKADRREKTIIVPPDFDKPFWVRGDEFSVDYAEQMARYFSQLLLTYQPTTASAQFDALLRYMDPTAYAAMKARLKAEAEKIVRNQASSVFYPTSIHVSKRSTFLTGELVGMLGKQVVSRKERRLEIRFEKRDSGIFISSLNDVTASQEAHQQPGATEGDERDHT